MGGLTFLVTVLFETEQIQWIHATSHINYKPEFLKLLSSMLIILIAVFKFIIYSSNLWVRTFLNKPNVQSIECPLQLIKGASINYGRSFSRNFHHFRLGFVWHFVKTGKLGWHKIDSVNFVNLHQRVMKFFCIFDIGFSLDVILTQIIHNSTKDKTMSKHSSEKKMQDF